MTKKRKYSKNLTDKKNELRHFDIQQNCNIV